MVSALLMKGVLCSIYAFQRKVVLPAFGICVFLLSETTRITGQGGFYVQAGNATKTWR